MINTIHPLYSSWKNMRSRCRNKNNSSYKNYGGRGITICSEWDDFKQFCIDLGDRPEGMTLDRIDNDGSYCKENCRWATISTQNRNSRQCKLSLDVVAQIRTEKRKKVGGKGGTGEGLTLRQLAKKYNTSYRNIRAILDGESWHMRVQAS